MRKQIMWENDEFVCYDEYAPYGVTGEQYDKNWERSEKLGVCNDDMCPLCAKPLKEGSYRTLFCTNESNTRYYMSPADGRESIKVGNGCFKRLMEAYKEKYHK